MEKFEIKYTDSFNNVMSLTRELDGDMDYYTLGEYFEQFLRGAGYTEGASKEILR